MIARATLALMLAGPVLVSGFAGGDGAANAASLTRKSASQAGHAGRERPTHISQRRNRGHGVSVSYRPARRDAPPAIVASVDDGLAYDTPRDTQGRPLHSSPPMGQVGLASWYGGARWQGRRMSDGTRYEQDKLTAAHVSLPLGSLVRVSLVNSGGPSVVVRITDRPGTRRRIIDLSRAAASQLGMLAMGVATVRLEPL